MDNCWDYHGGESERRTAMNVARELIEQDGKLHKVRTKGCYGSAGAEGLRKRAVAAGFTGAFRFRDRAK